MLRQEYRNSNARDDGLMTIEFDIASGTVHTVASGFWTVDQVASYFRDWRDIVARMHATNVHLSALVDMSASGVQRAEVIDIIAAATIGLYKSTDAIAMIVPSSLTKMQFRRILNDESHNFFLSPSAARMWLDSRAICKAPIAV